MKKYIALFISGIIVFAACSKKTVPSANAGKITYTAGVLPLLQSRCTPCHYPDQGGKVASFATYDNVRTHIDEMLVRVQLDPTNQKFMPFKNKKPALSTAQIDTLKRWASDGYIN